MIPTRTGVKVRDSLFGDIEFSLAEMQLLKSKAIQRLQGVHMSIPIWLLKTRPSPTRFAHTLSVAHLAKIVTLLPDFVELGPNLFCAAVAHDMGTPPFSHSCDPPMKRCLSLNHEDLALQLIAEEDFSDAARRLGAELPLIKELLRGKWFRSAPDLDNAPNTLHYGLEMGICDRMYDPRHIAQAYCLVDGQLCLKPQARAVVERWAACRESVYGSFVYHRDHQAPYLMLRRAVEVAEKIRGLPKSFFNMTDKEAYRWLGACNIRAVDALLAAAEAKDYYEWAHCSDETVALLRSVDSSQLADDIASHFKLSPEKICVGYGTNRGQKMREIPFTDELGTPDWPLPRKLTTWKLFVFAAKDIGVTGHEISDYVEKRISRLLYVPQLSPIIPTQQPALV